MADISGNTVTGTTPPAPANANGIAIQFGTRAHISHNTLTNLLSAHAEHAAVGILAIDADANTRITRNTLNGSNIAIFCANSGDNLTISENTVYEHTDVGIYVQDTAGLTLIKNNLISAASEIEGRSGEAVELSDGFLCLLSTSGHTNYNLFLFSGTNTPFQLGYNQFIGGQNGIGVQGSFLMGPVVAMDYDSFVGTENYYIQEINAPHNIWPTTASVSFDGLVSGHMSHQQFLHVSQKRFDKNNDSALGLVLDFIPPPAVKPFQVVLPPSHFVGVFKKDKLLRDLFQLLKATWEPSPSPDVSLYRIYHQGAVVFEVSADQPLVFAQWFEFQNISVDYQVVAVSAAGIESAPVPLKVTYKH